MLKVSISSMLGVSNPNTLPSSPTRNVALSFILVNSDLFYLPGACCCLIQIRPPPRKLTRIRAEIFFRLSDLAPCHPLSLTLSPISQPGHPIFLSRTASTCRRFFFLDKEICQGVKDSPSLSPFPAEQFFPFSFAVFPQVAAFVSTIPLLLPDGAKQFAPQLAPRSPARTI